MSFRKLWAAAATMSVLAGVTFAYLASASGAVTPPWEPDSHSVGNLTFYDAAGNVVTSGSDLTHLFDFAAATTDKTKNSETARLGFGFPDHAKADPTQWFHAALSGSTSFPVSSPAPLAALGANRPVAQVAASEGNLSALLGTVAFDHTAGYDDIVQIAMYDAGSDLGAGEDTSQYWSADISFDATAGTWTQVYPIPATAATPTTTTLAVTPNGSAATGTSVTLTATVTAGVAGKVQFFDGATQINGDLTVAAGTASTSTTALTAGSHSLKATFVPADATAFAGSSSPATSYTITAAATQTTTSLTASPTSSAAPGAAVTLTATVSPPGAAGTVQFLDGATSINAAATVTGGTASTTTATLAAGSHSLKATFTPTDSATFTTSSSAVTSYSITNATPTTTSLTVTPPTPITVGATSTLTATVTASVAGSVQFMDGAATIGAPVTVAAGTASTTTTFTVGTHSVTAAFTPTDTTTSAPSTSTAMSYVVQAPATTTSLAVTPAGPVNFGATVHLDATVAPATAAGQVAFFDGANQVGTPVAVTNGAASATTTALSSGTHQLTAQFTPTDSTAFGASTSTVSSLTVNAQSTTTSLTATPSSPVNQGTSVNLHAVLTPASAVGGVQFFDGATSLGTVPVASGVADFPTTSLSVATHSLTAVFTPTDPASFTTSTSTAVPLTVNTPPAGATTTTLGVSPTGAVLPGASVQLTATVGPSTATGSVQFLNGSANLGSAVTVSSGTAQMTTTSLPIGSNPISAVFTPSNGSFLASTSSTTNVVVNAPPATTTTTLTATPSSGAVDDTVTLIATLTPTTAAGTVQFADGGTALGNPIALTAGIASATTTFTTAAAHALTAVFTPTDPSAFATSTGSLSYTVAAAFTTSNVTVADASGTALSTSPQLIAGQTTTVTVTGLTGGVVLQTTVYSDPQQLGSVTANSSGVASFTFVVPGSLDLGSHVLVFAGTGSATVARLAFTVVAPPTNSTTTPTSGVDSTSLAATGAVQLQLLSIVGMSFIMFGSLIIALGWRRPDELARR